MAVVIVLQRFYAIFGLLFGVESLLAATFFRAFDDQQSFPVLRQLIAASRGYTHGDSSHLVSTTTRTTTRRLSQEFPFLFGHLAGSPRVLLSGTSSDNCACGGETSKQSIAAALTALQHHSAPQGQKKASPGRTSPTSESSSAVRRRARREAARQDCDPVRAAGVIQRRTVEQPAEFAPMVQILDPPVPQSMVQLVEVLRLFDTMVPEQVIDVPKITSQDVIPQRAALRVPQMAEEGPGERHVLHYTAKFRRRLSLQGGQPAPLSEVAGWQSRVQRHTVEQLASFAPFLVQILDGPVPLMVEQLVDVLQFVDALVPVAEQVIDVPKIILENIPKRLFREPQLVEQLVEVPTEPAFCRAGR